MSALYSTKTLASEWGCSRARVNHLVRKGQLGSFRTGNIIRIRREDVEAYIAEYGIPEVRELEAASVVYFIRCGEFVKIGQGIDAPRRVLEFQIGNPYPVVLLATDPGYTTREAELHRRFRHLHHRGEWFRYEGDLVEYIAGLAG